MPPSRKSKPRLAPVRSRDESSAIKISKRGTLIANLAGLNLRLHSGWHRRIKWLLLLLAATGGGLAAFRHLF